MVQPKYYWYVASPYSGPREVMESRFEAVCHFTAWAMKDGHTVYSPIVHCHYIAHKYSLPTDANFWQEFDEKMVLAGGGVIVLCIPGWRESKGVNMEIALAYSHGLPVLFALVDEQDYILLATAPKE